MDYMENYRRIPKVQNDADYKLDKILSEPTEDRTKVRLKLLSDLHFDVTKGFAKRVTFHPDFVEAVRLSRKLDRIYRHSSRRVKSYIRRLMRLECTAQSIIVGAQALRRYGIPHQQAKTLQKRKGK